jgi:L-glyceraldehyde 3-phosphate reductase
MRPEFLTDETLGHVRELNRIATGRGQTLAQLALSWTLRQPSVSSALIGASSVRQLEENLAAATQTTFEAEELAEIDRHAIDLGINLWHKSSES